jgi:AraC-like DNA-binding protein
VAPFDFRRREPEPGLGRFVATLWYARGQVPYARERIAPTGSAVAVLVLGEPILQTPEGGETLRADRGFLVGPHDRPATNEPTGETFAVGVVSTPVGCEALFGVPPSTIRGRAVELEAAWPAAAELRARLLTCEDPEEMLDLLAGALTPNEAAVVGLDRCERAVAMLERDPARPIAEIAAELDVSHGHLDREFVRIVGLSPRSLAQLLRARKLLAMIDVHEGVDWAEAATDLGWYDQAHLIRDFKRYTGVTPSQYVAAQRASFTEADDAAGFVPEPT